MKLKKSYAFHALTGAATFASLALVLRTPWIDARSTTYAAYFTISSLSFVLSIALHFAMVGTRAVKLRFDSDGIWMNEVLVARRHYDLDGSHTFEALVVDDPQAALIVSAVSLPLRRTRFAGASLVPRQTALAGVLSALAVTAFALMTHQAATATILAVCTVFASAVLVLSRIQSWIDVGSDGILRTWLGRHQFVALREIREARRVGDDKIAITLDSGRRASVVFARSVHEPPDTARHNRDAALVRLDTSLGTNRGASAPAWLIAHLGCRGRDAMQWVRDLADARATASDYRASPLRDEDLWRILEDPLAPEDARAGAAVALRRSDDPRAGARLRVTAEAIASPQLRLTLEASAREDVTDVMLAELLDAFGGALGAKRHTNVDAT